jgi:putative aldouronate transport system permease protein
MIIITVRPRPVGRAHPVLRDIRKRWMLHLFVWCGIAFLIVFSIIPITGLQIAFRTYNLKDGFAGFFTGDFVGFKYFNQFLGDRKFPELLRNTLCISALKLLINFPLAIAFAIMITEMPGRKFKRLVQTVSYLPHFISWVIVSGLLFTSSPPATDADGTAQAAGHPNAVGSGQERLLLRASRDQRVVEGDGLERNYISGGDQRY